MSGGASATTIIAGASLALAAAGTATSVIGQMQQAKAAQASANYQSEVAAGNQQIANKNASYAGAEGEAQAGISEQKTRQQEGAILAGQASSGVDVNSPTSTAVRTSQDELGQLDAQTIKSNAAQTAYGFETQSTQYGNTAAAEEAQGENAATAGEIGAGTGLLSGAGNAGLNYANVMKNSSGINADNINGNQ